MAAAGSWATFAALLLAASVSPFDYSILNVALPTIARDTRATSADLEWMVVSYAIAYVAVMLIGASAGDRLGRRRVLNLGLLAFGLASVGAYMASTPTQIIAARSAMGLGSSLIVPMSLSLIQTSGTAAQRAGAIRIWGAMAGLSLALGPVAGGALISGSGWRAIFALDATAAAAALLLSLMFVTESRSAEPGSVDWLGSALSVVALLCLLWAFITGAERGWTARWTMSSLLVGNVALLVFLMWERRCAHPMLDLRLLADKAFHTPLLCLLATNFALPGALFVSSQYLQFVLGVDAFGAGLALAPLALGMFVTSLLCGRLSARYGFRRIVLVALSAQALGFLGAAMLTPTHATWGFAVALGVSGLGLGLIYVSVVDALLDATPSHLAGVGAATQHIGRQVSAAVGVAVMGAVLAATYARGLPDDNRIASNPHAAAEARKSIGAALSSIDPHSTDLIATVRHAFTNGTQIALAVGVLSCCGGILLAWRRLESAAMAVPGTEPSA